MPSNNNDEGIGTSNASIGINENASGTPLEILLKANNELILSLHKKLAKTEQNIICKIVSFIFGTKIRVYSFLL